MKVVFAAKFNKNSTNVSQSNAMRRQGIELVEFEIGVMGYDDRLIEVCRREKPQLLLLSKCQGMNNRVIGEIQAMGIKCFLWFMDPLFTFNRFPEMAERVRLCDHSFFTIWEALEGALNISKKCSFLREGFDSDIDYPRVLEYERDVAFIGNLRKGRYHYYEGSNFDLITTAYGDMHAKVVSSTKINLNFTDGGAQDRVYKVMASGGFLLTEPWARIEDDFEIGVDLDVFTTPEELNDKILYYLENDEVREMIAKNGYKKVICFSRDEWCLEIIKRFSQMIDFTDAPVFGRQEGLIKALRLVHASRSNDIVIVETGTTRGSLGGGVKGDGWATLAWGWYCLKYGGSIFTIDCLDEAINNCKDITLEYADNIEYVVGDSVGYLQNFSQPIDLLYLDSCDDPNHILNELKGVYGNLKDDSIILIDDTDSTSGKGEHSITYLRDNGWNIEFIDECRQVMATRG